MNGRIRGLDARRRNVMARAERLLILVEKEVGWDQADPKDERKAARDLLLVALAQLVAELL